MSNGQFGDIETDIPVPPRKGRPRGGTWWKKLMEMKVGQSRFVYPAGDQTLRNVQASAYSVALSLRKAGKHIRIETRVEYDEGAQGAVRIWRKE